MILDGKTSMQVCIELTRNLYGEGLVTPLLAQLCQLHRVSVREFAEIFGISKSYAQQLMNHEKMPSLDLALRICRYYECTVEELFGWRVDDDGSRRPLLVEIPGQEKLHRVNNRTRGDSSMGLIGQKILYLAKIKEEKLRQGLGG